MFPPTPTSKTIHALAVTLTCGGSVVFNSALAPFNEQVFLEGEELCFNPQY